MLPLQLVDSILLDYHLGHILLLAFVASILGVLPLKSQKVLATVVMGFGAIFLMAPFTTMPAPFILAGVGLAVVGPLLWTTADS
ncbi:hypothetical protein JCM17823_24110 [Halorubrum gandharaense]